MNFVPLLKILFTINIGYKSLICSTIMIIKVLYSSNKDLTYFIISKAI